MFFELERFFKNKINYVRNVVEIVGRWTSRRTKKDTTALHSPRGRIARSRHVKISAGCASFLILLFIPRKLRHRVQQFYDVGGNHLGCLPRVLCALNIVSCYTKELKEAWPRTRTPTWKKSDSINKDSQSLFSDVIIPHDDLLGGVLLFLGESTLDLCDKCIVILCNKMCSVAYNHRRLGIGNQPGLSIADWC